jgi:molybdenum cofactor synthesis domain-containing protein
LNNPFKVAILICSDRCFSGEREDRCGAALSERLQDNGFIVAEPEICPDDLQAITNWLQERLESDQYDLILTSGGTGLAARDVTPEATLNVIERRVPGLEEAMRAASLHVTPHAMLSRGVAGTADRTLIVNLPGSPKGALENLEVILPSLPHAIALQRGEKPDP